MLPKSTTFSQIFLNVRIVELYRWRPCVLKISSLLSTNTCRFGPCILSLKFVYCLHSIFFRNGIIITNKIQRFWKYLRFFFHLVSIQSAVFISYPLNILMAFKYLHKYPCCLNICVLPKFIDWHSDYQSFDIKRQGLVGGN